MRYYPYFRGKQFELLLLREFAGFLRDNEICPIIEPVKTNMAPLCRAIDGLNEQGAPFILVANPQVGDFAPSREIHEQLVETIRKSHRATLGLIINEECNIGYIRRVIAASPEQNFAVIHQGFDRGRMLAEAINGLNNIREHIFIDGSTSKLYQKHFGGAGVRRILVRDSFKSENNAKYKDYEHFSDLHQTYRSEGMNAFGDYLIVANEYSTTGGPAYAVAIHITYLLSESEDEDMFVYHFKSIQNSTPTDPAGKFNEAVSRLVKAYQAKSKMIFHSRACDQFVRLYEEGHFPGLGKVKQISMQHHLEVIADFLSRHPIV